MRITIVDDKKLNITILSEMLMRMGISQEEISHASTIDKAKEVIEETQPELLFLDIELGVGYGFDVLEASSYQDFEVVFITAHPNYALKSYAYNPIHFLLKPFSESDLHEVMRRFELRRQKSTTENLPKVSKPTEENQVIALPEKGKLHFVELGDILYFEASNVYSICHLKSRNSIVVSKTLRTYDEILPKDCFCRIHDRYLINLKQVALYTKGRGGDVILKDGTTLSVSQRRKDHFLKQIEAMALK
ncbi:MAG: LytTR family DNA-binding domain-containing protein [Bacteroidota bacterium]